jgi:hypothetical protein
MDYRPVCKVILHGSVRDAIVIVVAFPKEIHRASDILCVFHAL